MRILKINIHMVEELVIHEAPVTFRVIRCQADIFIKVKTLGLREANQPLLV
ncbi:hypothetical protein D3C85_1603930 [compost metagenome]